MDKFYEQFISKDYGILPNAINIISKAILLLGIAIFAIVGIGGIFLALPAFIVFILLEIFMSKSFLEYEYEYYNKDITISKIIGKKRRKVIGNIKVDNILNVSNVNNIEKSEKVIRCTIKGLNLKEIVVFVNENNKKVGYLLGLDEELYSILKKDNPRLFNYI